MLFLERLYDGFPQFRLQSFLIAFHHQNIIRILSDDLLRRFALAMHGVSRDDRARQIEHVDQLLHGGNFVRFILDRFKANAHF